MRLFPFLMTLVVLSGFAVSPASAHEFKAGTIAIGHPWSRPAPGTATPAVGYLVLDNQGVEDDAPVGTSSPMASLVTLHRTEVKDGIARMVRLTEPLSIPAHQTVKLEPGGYHLMLSGRTAAFAPGQMDPLTLEFEKAGTVEVELKVERTAPADHGAHQTMAQ